MSDSSVLEQVSLGQNESEPQSLRINLYQLNKTGRIIPEEVRVILEQQTGDQLTRVGGSPSREAFYNKRTGEVLLVVNTLNQPVILTQVRRQVEFYEKYKNDKVFTDIIPPITRQIVGWSGRTDTGQETIIGMGQRFIGTELDNYKKRGGTVTPAQINDFIERYRRVIQLTHETHGDLVHSRNNGLWNVEWSNIRIQPETGRLYLIDYQGKQGHPQPLSPAKSNSEEADKALKEPQQLQEALFQYFGLSEQMAA